MSLKHKVAPYLLPVVVLFSEIGCPDCAYPVEVEVFAYACEYAPCEAKQTTVSLEYSFEGGPFLPCDGTGCGDDSGSCGADTNGTYRIVARSGTQSAEATTVVEKYNCMSGGSAVTVTLGELKCPPRAEVVAPVGGTVTWDVGDTAGSAMFPDAASQLQVTSSAVLVQRETDEGRTGDQLAITLAEEGIRWELKFQLGDLRSLAVGEYEIGSEADLSGFFLGVCGPGGGCATQGDENGATLIVEEAVGGALPWPDIVTDDFYRRYRLLYQSVDLLDNAVSTACQDCTVDTSISFDLTFIRSAKDYALDDDGNCSIE